MKDNGWKVGLPPAKKMNAKLAKLDKEAARLKQWGKTGKEPKK
jgi:hypothetical protein